MIDYISIEQAKSEYFKRTNGNGHFFSKGAMLFFNSRLSQDAILSEKGNIIFVTSERCPHKENRKYSIRCISQTGNVMTPNGFRNYSASGSAWRAAKRMIDDGEI